MVCVKVVCERERVTKMVCDKVVCKRRCGERWCVTKLCVCERWCGERWCATKLCVKDGVVKDGVRQSCV